jgi:hypothetical protein
MYYTSLIYVHFKISAVIIEHESESASCENLTASQMVIFPPSTSFEIMVRSPTWDVYYTAACAKAKPS